MKMNSRISLQIQQIDCNISKIQQEYQLTNSVLQEKFNIEDQHFDYKYEDWTDNDWEYQEHNAEIYYKTQKQIDVLNAKKAVQMLLGYHIARPNKPLHEGTVLKKLKKLNPADSDFIRTQMQQSFNSFAILGQEAYLHQELHKYGITLFDSNHYLMLLRNQSQIKESSLPDDIKNKRLKENDDKLKLFRSAIRKKYQSQYQTITK